MNFERQYTQPVLVAILRVLVYSAVLLGISHLIFLDSTTLTHTGKFGEHSYTEWTQEIFIFLCAVIYFFLGRSNRAITGFTGVLSGMSLMAFIREYNNYFHTWFRGAWQILVLIVLIATVIYVYKNRDTLIKPFFEYISLPAFGVKLSGFITLMVFSRLFGRGTMWRNILEVDHLEGPTRWVKNAAEEGTELLGYALMFIAAVEYMWFIINKKRKEQKG